MPMSPFYCIVMSSEVAIQVRMDESRMGFSRVDWIAFEPRFSGGITRYFPPATAPFYQRMHVKQLAIQAGIRTCVLGVSRVDSVLSISIVRVYNGFSAVITSFCGIFCACNVVLQDLVR